MSDPAIVLASIHKDAEDLDAIAKAVYVATNELDEAEQLWDEILDNTTADLEEEFAQAGRKSVPEHTALSAARRQNRAVYQEFRKAKHKLERLQMQLKAKTAALNGRQSELRALADESRLPAYAQDRPATQTYGGVRAA